jgi:toxin YoeB
MEVFYNEISNQPFAENQTEARHKIFVLLDTLKELRSKGFNVMRTHRGFYADLLSENYSFSSFFSDPSVSVTLKTLLRSVVVSPFISDDDSYEAEQFVINNFSTENHLHEDISPEGLASAYIFNSPTISLLGDSYWQNEFLLLNVISTDDNEKQLTIEVPNVFSVKSIYNDFFSKWLNTLTEGIQLNSSANIYKLFPADKFSFDKQAITDIISWYYDDKRFLIRIKDLINDISENPFKDGKGKTEILSGHGGLASKRIIKKDRIVYTYTKEKITIHQCRKHYNDK